MFLHRLALALGKTVGEIERTMSERELRDWLRFTMLRPLPDQLADIHVAMLCSIAANLMRNPADSPIPVEAFFVLRDPEPPKPAPQQSEAERFRAHLAGG